jgi:hypothetical protein
LWMQAQGWWWGGGNKTTGWNRSQLKGFELQRNRICWPDASTAIRLLWGQCDSISALRECCLWSRARSMIANGQHNTWVYFILKAIHIILVIVGHKPKCHTWEFRKSVAPSGGAIFIAPGHSRETASVRHSSIQFLSIKNGSNRTNQWNKFDIRSRAWKED